jgi:hypothetical protein
MMERAVHIEALEVENFRSIQKATIQFDSVTSFVGRNGVGKSTVLYALESFFNVGAQYSQLDYYNHEMADQAIRIRLTFASLRREELREFSHYVHAGKLVVTKVVNQGGARYYGMTAQIPDFAELRALGAIEKRARLKAKIEAGDFPGFGELPRKSDEVDVAMDRYEQQNPARTVLIEREKQFLGPKNIGGGKLDNYTRFVLVPAVRDASSEMDRRGAVMQLLDLIVTQSIASRQDFKDFQAEFEEKVRLLYGRENLPELQKLGELITQRLARYAPGSELVIDFGEVKPPAIPLPETVVSVSEDEFKVPIRYSGHGLQRALILALLEQLTLARPVAASEEPGNVDAEDSATQPIPDVILAIEEPELYLHPGRSRYLFKILAELAVRTGDPALPRMQVMYVTHSAHFVAVERFDQMRMCRKIRTLPGEPKASSYSSFSRLQAAQRLAQIYRRDASSFTGQSFATHAVPILNTLVNEALFADVAVIVEGDSDVAALWVLQEKKRAGWDELGVLVAPVGGKNKIDRAVVVLEGFGIPTFFVFDGDRSEQETAQTNRALLELGNQPPIDFPNTFVGERCAAFEENIETYMQGAIGESFVDWRRDCASQCGHEKPKNALKNSVVMSRFVLRAFEEGKPLPVLEEIVDRVTRMALSLK